MPTYNGTTSADVIDGSVDPDEINGDAGDDQLYGHGSDDTIYGDEGNDLLEGGDGSDSLSGGTGNDTVFGGVGDDTIDGGADNDQLSGGDGDDVITGGSGNDTIGSAEANTNLITNGSFEDGTHSANGVNGLDGWTTASGSPDSADDGAAAESWNPANSATDGTGYVTMWGTTNGTNESIQQTLAAPLVAGTTYTLSVNAISADQVAGQWFTPSDIPVTFELYDPSTGTSLGSVTVQSTSYEPYSFSFTPTTNVSTIAVRPVGEGVGTYPSVIIDELSIVEGYGEAGNDSIDAGEGDDVIYAGSGDDTIHGGDGIDTIHDSEGNDFATGGEGRDDFVYTTITGSDTVVGGELNDTAPINSGDKLNAHDSVDDLTVIFDGDESGLMTDGNGEVHFSEIEHILGGQGSDSIDASRSSVQQILDGGEGSDTITGGSGDDIIALGLTQDFSATDNDNDLLILRDGFGDDSIEGFEGPTDLGGGNFVGRDMVDVTGLTDVGGNLVDVDDVTVTDTNGDGTGDAILSFPNGESITLWGVSPKDISSPAQLEAIGIPAAGASNYVVEGTGSGDLIDGDYTTDPQGDRVDNLDHSDGSNDDIIRAGGGNDTVVGGDGSDTISGDAGNDTIYGDANPSAPAPSPQSITTSNVSSTTDGFTVTAQNVVGGTLTSASNGNVVDGGGWFGAGGTVSDTDSGVQQQIAYDLASGLSETLIVDFDDPISALEFTTYSLQSASFGEVGHYDLYLDGVLVGSSDFTDTTGSGNDTFNVSGFGAFDQIVFTALIQTDFTDGSDYGISDITFTPAAPDSTPGDDSISGGEGADAIYGQDGDDTIVLEDNFGNDTIVGGEASETDGDTLDLSAVTSDTTIDLTSADPEAGSVSDGSSTAGFSEIETIVLGSGTDTIVLADGSGADAVSNFTAPTDNGDGTYTGEDQLDVSGMTDASGMLVNVDDVTVTGDSDGNAVLTFPNGESITLVGVAPATVTDPAALVAMGIPDADDTFTLYDSIELGSGTPGIGATLTTSGGDLVEVDEPLVFDVDTSGSIQAGDTVTIDGTLYTVTAINVLELDVTYDGGTSSALIKAHGLVLDDGSGGQLDYIIPVDVAGALPDITAIEVVDTNPDTDIHTADQNANNNVTLATTLDYIVEGTVTGDLIDTGYVGDPDGDMVDNLDHIDGSNDDSIEGYAGDDTIFAGLGDDTVDAGDDNDIVFGEAGADSISGGAGDDQIDGGTENDQIEGDAGNDVIEGGDGNDSIRGGADDDYITGDAGNDEIHGDAGMDTVYGGTGNDTISLGDNNDVGIGGEGSDEIHGDGGDDQIFGDEPGIIAFDTAAVQGAGGAGASTASMGSFPTDELTFEMQFVGDAMPVPGPTADAMTSTLMSYATTGSPGEFGIHLVSDNEVYDTGTPDPLDTIIETGYLTIVVNGVEYTSAITTNSLLDGNDQSLAVTFDAAGQAVQIYTGGVLADTITLNNTDPLTAGGTLMLANGQDGTGGFSGGVHEARLWDDIRTPGEIDTFDDTRLGDEIADPNLVADWLPDPFTGGLRDDVGGNDLTPFGDTEVVATGVTGNDTIFGGDGSDTIIGSAGDDSLDGDNAALTGGADYISGGAGADTIIGDVGNDTLYGGDGNDDIYAGADDDLVRGGRGADIIYGQEGNDTLDASGTDFDADSVYGGDDRDYIYAGVHDLVDGGSGGDDFDTLDLSGTMLPGGTRNIVITGTDSNGNGFDGYVEYFNALGVQEGVLNFTEIEAIIPCFTPGTEIATGRGLVRIEELRLGDRVQTRDNGLQAIEWIGERTLTAGEIDTAPHLRPVLIRKGSLGDGLPNRDMLVSPQHRMLVGNSATEMWFGQDEVLVPAIHMTCLDGIDQVNPGAQSYIHFMCNQHEVVFADDTWTESFQPGDSSLLGLDEAAREELFTLFPDLRGTTGRRNYMSARMSLKKHESAVLFSGNQP